MENIKEITHEFKDFFTKIELQDGNLTITNYAKDGKVYEAIINDDTLEHFIKTEFFDSINMLFQFLIE